MKDGNITEDYKSDKNVEKLFKERQDERVELIKEGISDINDMIKERGILHKELLKSLDKLDLFIDNTMPKMDALVSSTNAAKSDILKELLKKKI